MSIDQSKDQSHQSEPANRPSLSVVVANYNHGHLLPVCLTAILEQSFKPKEILVMDDGSTDESRSIIEKFAKEHPVIRTHFNERNLGVIPTINHGLQLISSDYVYFAAADDKILPGLFQKSMDILARHPQAAFACAIGDWYEMATGLNWQVGVGMADRPSYLSPERLVELERHGKLFIATHTAVIRRAALEPWISEIKWHADWFGLYVAAFRHGICFVPEPLGVFNIHPHSFYKRGYRDKNAYRDVLRHMLDRLCQPRYADAAALIRESGALFLFGLPILRLMLATPPYRRFVTPLFLRKNLWHGLKLEVKRFTPRFAAEWYFRLAGYKMPAIKTNR